MGTITIQGDGLSPLCLVTKILAEILSNDMTQCQKASSCHFYLFRRFYPLFLQITKSAKPCHITVHTLWWDEIQVVLLRKRKQNETPDSCSLTAQFRTSFIFYCTVFHAAYMQHHRQETGHLPQCSVYIANQEELPSWSDDRVITFPTVCRATSFEIDGDKGSELHRIILQTC